MLDRREWLRRATAAAAAPLAAHLLPHDVLAWGRDVHAAIARQSSPPELDADTLRLLSTVCERIIPTDDTPGAISAGVPRFIDHMLGHWYDAPERTRVVDGVRDLDAQARDRFGRPYLETSAADQDTLLLALDGLGEGSWFATVKYLTIWGYYTSEAGVTRELQQWPSPGRYDGYAPYVPRTRRVSQAAVVAPRGTHVAE
jgi:gluconate 2-dehydrogenase gamma chain